MAAVYKCLGCGTTNGSPAENGSENWYWRTYTHGRVGPFHSIACSASFHLEDETKGEAAFTLPEYQHLEYLRDLYEKAR